MRVTGDRHRRDEREDLRPTRTEGTAKIPVRPGADAAQDGRAVKDLAGDWKYDAVSIGYPGPVLHDHIDRRTAQPRTRMDRLRLLAAFGCPSRSSTMPRCRRSAATAAARCYSWARNGPRLRLVADGVVDPMEIGHLSFRNRTYED